MRGSRRFSNDAAGRWLSRCRALVAPRPRLSVPPDSARFGRLTGTRCPLSAQGHAKVGDPALLGLSLNPPAVLGRHGSMPSGPPRPRAPTNLPSALPDLARLALDVAATGLQQRELRGEQPHQPPPLPHRHLRRNRMLIQRRRERVRERLRLTRNEPHLPLSNASVQGHL